jgi:hypothetical protein
MHWTAFPSLGHAGVLVVAAGPAPHTAGGAGWLTLGIALALALLTLYTLMRVRSSEWPELDHAVALVAASTTLIAGLRLVVVALTAEELAPFAPEDRIFIPVAGLALILVSLREIVRVMRDGTND